MSALNLSKPERRDQLLLRSAPPIALLTLLGAADERLDHRRLIKANTVRWRTHSLLKQSFMPYGSISNWPEHRAQPLIGVFDNSSWNHAYCAASLQYHRQ